MPFGSNSTKIDAEQRYAGYRDAVYHHVHDGWVQKIRKVDGDLRLLPIDDDALQQCEKSWRLFPEDGKPEPFPWRKLFYHEKGTPRRFEMAIWNGSVLCGLTIGRASRSSIGDDSNVTITFVQGAPRLINRLKGFIAPIVIDAAEAYATVLQRPMVYIKDPLVEVQPYYLKLGFSVAKRRCKGQYIGKRV